MTKILKIIFVILFIVIIIGGGLILLNIIPLSGPKIAEAVVSKEVNPETGEPIDVANEFKSDIPSIFCVIKTKNVKGESLIKAEWFYEKQKLSDNSLTVPGKPFLYYNRYLYFELKKSENADWNAGNYEIKIYLNNELEKLVSFKIKEEEGQAKEAKISDAIICKNVDENYAPIDKIDIFSPDIEKIYCSVKITSAQKGAVIKAQWWNKSIGQLLDSSSYTVLKDNSAGNIAFSYSTEGQKLEVGDYEAKIYVGDKLIKVAPFKIK